MGYTHYWTINEPVKKSTFIAIATDFVKVVDVAKQHGVEIAGPNGDGVPIITDEEISFNGIENCGHTQQDLGIVWPSEDAGGVANENETVTKGDWFGGKQLQKRTCGGECCHETFRVELSDLGFQFCKTAFKNYDILVTAILIIIKKHMKNDVSVSSDGEDELWFDGKMVCQTVLGYGLGFKLVKVSGGSELVVG